MRRIARILVRIVLGALILGAVGALVVLLWARSDSGRRHVRDAVVGEMRRVLPGLEIGRISGNLTRDLVLEDLRVRDREGREAVHIDRVEARIDLLGLLHHELRLERLVLVRPRVDARANLAEIARSSPAAGAPYALDVRAIQIEDGTYTSEAVQASAVAATGTLRRDASGLKATISSLTGRAHTAERSIDIGGAGRVESNRGLTRVIVDRLAASGLAPAALVASGRMEGRRVDAEIAIGMAGHAHVVGEIERAGYRAEIDLDADPHDLDERLRRGHIEGHVSAAGTGWPLTKGSHASIFLSLARSRIEDLAIVGALIHGHLDGAAWRVDEANLHALGLAIGARGHGQGAQIALELDAHAGRPVTLLGVQAAGRIHASLSGSITSAMEIETHFDLQTIRYRQYRVDRLRGIAQFSKSGSIRTRKIDSYGQNEAIRTRKMHLIAQNVGTSRLQLPLIAEIDVRSGPELIVGVQIKGGSTLAQAELHGHVDLSHVDVAIAKAFVERDQHRLVLNAPARLRWRRGGALELGPAQVSGEIGGVKVPDARFAAKLDARARTVSVGIDGVVGDARAPVHLAARLPIAMHGPVDVTLDATGLRLADLPSLVFARRELRDGRVELHLRLDGDTADPRGRVDLALRDARLGAVGGLAADLRVDASAGTMSVRGEGREGTRCVLAWSGTWATGLTPLLHGEIPRHAPVQLHANVEGVNLAKLHTLDPRLAQASGLVHADADVTGSLARPAARIHLDASGAQLDVIRFARLDATAEWTPGALRASLLAEPAAGGRLHGTLSWGARTHELDLHARALDLRFLPALAAGIRDAAGTLDADVAVTEANGVPVANGTLAVHHGRLGIRGLHEMDDVELTLQLSGGRADVGRLHARSGGGSLDGSGRAELDGLRLRTIDLTADAHQFELGYGGLLRARLDGRVHLGGGMVDDRLALRINVENGQLALEQIGADHALQPTGPLADVRFVDAAGLAASRETPQGKTPVRGPARDLEIAIGLPDFGVRGKEIDAALDGRVAVSTSTDGLPIVTGEIAVKHGSVEVFGQRFDIEHARLRWSGDPGDLDPSVDVRVSRAFADANVAVELSGTLAKPEIRLSSDPPAYDQTQLVAMVLGGQPQAGEMGEAVSPAGTISSVILGQIVDQIAPQLPLDVLRVDLARESAISGAPAGVNDVTETRVEVGKHLTDRVTLSYVHLFGAPENQNHNEAHVDYRLGRRWIVETAFGDAGVGGVDVFWTWRY